MEKRRPTHDLREIKRAFFNLERLTVTTTALRSATSLGFDRAAIVETIQSIEPRHFNKSMTSYADHRQWQDVYFVPSDAGVLYVKFTNDAVTEFLLLSFKEKDDV